MIILLYLETCRKLFDRMWKIRKQQNTEFSDRIIEKEIENSLHRKSFNRKLLCIIVIFASSVSLLYYKLNFISDITILMYIKM